MDSLIDGDGNQNHKKKDGNPGARSTSENNGMNNIGSQTRKKSQNKNGDKIRPPSPKDKISRRKQSHEILSFECEMCDSFFRTKTDVLLHTSIVHSPQYGQLRRKTRNELECPNPNCDETFRRVHFLKQHLLSEHPDTLPLILNELQKDENENEALDSSQSQVERWYKCGHCSLKYSWLPSMLRHMKKMHNVLSVKLAIEEKSDSVCDVEEKQYQCIYCSLKYTWLPSMISHMEKIHNVSTVSNVAE